MARISNDNGASLVERSAPWLRMQTSRRALESQVEADRERRHEQYLQKLDDRSLQKSPTLRILAEGDSWFDYPLDAGGVIDHLELLIDLPIDNMAHHGDEVRQMLGLKQRREIERRVQSLGHHVFFDAILFSGGGNDFVGDPFLLWIKPFNGNPADPAVVAATDPANLIDQRRFDAVLDIVEAGYRDLIEIRDHLSPTSHLFFHGYDFAIPSGKPICCFGPWLKPGLDARGIPAALQAGVVKCMLLQSAARIRSLADPKRRIHFVETPGTLNPLKHWANELHPNPTGFALIAEKFRDALALVFPVLAPHAGPDARKALFSAGSATPSANASRKKDRRKRKA